MPISPKGNWDEPDSGKLEAHATPQQASDPANAPPYENTLVAPTNVPHFRYRMLVVDDDAMVAETAKVVLESEGYEVLTVGDGLDALQALAKSLPDVIISDLNMPRMSGFEFLAVVRKRFPHIGVIAMSGEYISSDTCGSLADAFLQKGNYTIRELVHKIATLLAASPIRSEREKTDNAPVFVPRDSDGYLVVTCTKCLRPSRLEASNLNGGIHRTACQSCRAPLQFEINHEIEPLMKRKRA